MTNIQRPMDTDTGLVVTRPKVVGKGGKGDVIKGNRGQILGDERQSNSEW